MGLAVAAVPPSAAQEPATPDTARVLPSDHPLRPQAPEEAPDKGERNALATLFFAPLRLADRIFYNYAAGLEERCGTFAGGITGEEGLSACGAKHVSYHFGSIGSKSGFWGAGFGIHNNLSAPTGFKTGFTVAATERLYQEYTAYVGWNHPEKRPYGRLTGFYDRDTRDEFWGLGPDSDEDLDTDYSRETFGAYAEVGVPPRFPFWGNVGGRYEKNLVFDGNSEKQDDTIEVFPDLPGIGPQQELWGPYANLVLDLTDAPLHPTLGIKVKGRGALYRSVDDQNFNFYTYGGEVQGHLPLGSEWHILSALAGFDTAEPENDDDEIPFTYLPYIGGSNRVRGHKTWRFMDRTAAYGTVEYRYRIWMENTPDPETASVIETALFYDVGGVEEKLKDVDWTAENSYGFEFRVYVVDKHLMRLGLARSDEGTRLNLKFTDIY